MSNGDWVIGLFNREDNTRNRSLDFSWLGFEGPAEVRDLWSHSDLGTMQSVSVDVPAHGCRIFKVVPQGSGNMYIGGSFNNWSLDQKMSFENGIWKATGVQISAGNHQMKFANTSDWSGDDWGNASGLTNTASLTTGGGSNITFSLANGGSYTITLDNQSKVYSIENEALVDGQVYKITARHSGKALDIAAESTVNGALAHQWEYLGANSQKWRIEDAGNGIYNLIAVHSGKALDVAGNSTQDGADVHQWDNYNLASQQWRFVEVGSGYFKIENNNSSKVLDVYGASTTNGAYVKQYTYTADPHQQWAVVNLSGMRTSQQAKVLASDQSQEEILLFPNPVEDVLNIILKQPTGKLEITNSFGLTVYEQEIKSKNLQLNLSSLASGVYVVRIVDGDELVLNRKIIINP
jgi:hypothetical protein